MNLLSWPVIIGAVVVGSPALWAALVEGTLSMDVALMRVGLCGVGIWVVLSVLTSLGSEALASARRSQAESGGQQEGQTDQLSAG